MPALLTKISIGKPAFSHVSKALAIMLMSLTSSDNVRHFIPSPSRFEASSFNFSARLAAITTLAPARPRVLAN